jgi:hypothetical protein
MNNATALAPKRTLTNTQAIFWGGLIAGVLDAIDGVIAYRTQGLNPVQVLQYIASGALGKSAFQSGLATAPSARRFISVSRGLRRRSSCWQAGGYSS